ncbi:MAG: NifU family protein [Nitrospiria bacterium]
MDQPRCGGAWEGISIWQGLIAYVEMSGGCQGCSMAGKTSRHGVMKILAEKFPQITDLNDVTDHSSGSKPFFQTETGNIPTFNS